MGDETAKTSVWYCLSKSRKKGIFVFCLSLGGGVLFALILNNYFRGWFNLAFPPFGTQNSENHGFPFKQTVSRYQQEKVRLQQHLAGKETSGLAYTLKLSSDPEPEIRRMAARALTRYNLQESTTTLRALTRDTSPAVRVAAIAALVTLQNREGLEEVLAGAKFSEAEKMRSRLGLYLIAKIQSDSGQKKHLKILTQYAASGDEMSESFVAQQLFDYSPREGEVASLAKRKVMEAQNAHLIQFILGHARRFSPQEYKWMQTRLNSLLANKDDRVKQAALRNLGVFCVSNPWSLMGFLVSKNTSMGVFEEALRQLGSLADGESVRQLDQLRKTSGWPAQRKRLIDQTYQKLAHGVPYRGGCNKTKLTAQMNESPKGDLELI